MSKNLLEIELQKAVRRQAEQRLLVTSTVEAIAECEKRGGMPHTIKALNANLVRYKAALEATDASVRELSGVTGALPLEGAPKPSGRR